MMACVLAGALIVVAAPRSAEAQVRRRFGLHGEGAVDTMLNDPQSREFGIGFHGVGRLSFTVAGPLAVQASAGG